MKKTKILSFVILLILNTIYAQEEETNLILSYPEESEISFYKYPIDTNVKAIYNNQTDVVNKYPEQLLESIISATNQEWVNYNTLGGEENPR